MKVLLYFEAQKVLSKSGIGRALEHQQRALAEVGVEYTTDPDCTDYDILHINTYGANSIHMVKKARKLGKKVIYHAHSTEEDFCNSFVASNYLAPYVKKYLVSLYNRADYLITPTAYSKSLLEGYGINVPIRAISNGIDLARFKPDPKKEATFRKYFKIQSDQKVIISVGLYFDRKGIEDFAEIAAAFPEYRFIWFGYTPLWSVPAHIRQLVTQDHPANLEFPGYIKGDILEGAYSGADLFFFPSYEETEGIVVLEALASQQHILVRDIPVYHGWLKAGKNCYQGHNNQEFCEQIEQIIAGKLPDTRAAGYQTAAARSLKAIGQEMKEVYEMVMCEKAVVEPYFY